MLTARRSPNCLRAHSPGAGSTARLGAVAFIHRFGSSLNAHLHFHCVVIDGVFDAATTGGGIFSAATKLDANAIADVQACVRRRLLRVFVRRGLLPGDDARDMAQWAHGGGFSVDASVRIEAADRAGRERLLRYCARPPFALDRLRELASERLVYDHPKPGPGGSYPLMLTPLELLDRLAARYAWALLLARIDEVSPLRCTHCGGAMRIIAFITDASAIRDILVHLGEPTAPPAHRARPRSATVADGQRRARSDPRYGVPARPDLRVRPAPHLVATTVHARLGATRVHAGARVTRAPRKTPPQRRPTTPSLRRPGRVNP